MERVHDDLSSHHGQKSMPKRIFLRNETDQKKQLQQSINATSNKKSVTDPLDEAMKELLDICQQYNDKLNIKISGRVGNKNKNTETGVVSIHYTSTDKNQSSGKISQLKQQQPSMESPKYLNCDKDKTEHEGLKSTALNCKLSGPSSESIERLQQKQGEIQAQLDEVLETAKALAAKQKSKLNSILEEEDNSHQNTIDDDDDELIEFQQIENELRISELNRQLDKIQEELRIRLYKQLLTNTKNGSNNNKLQVQNQSNKSQDLRINGSSPCSSSCSDVPTSSSNSATFMNQKGNHNSPYDCPASKPSSDAEDLLTSKNETNFTNQSDRQLISGSQDVIYGDNEYAFRSYLEKNESITPTNDTPDTGIQSNNLSNIDFSADYEVLTTSKESVNSSKRCQSTELTNIYNNITNNPINIASQTAPTAIFSTSNNASPTCLSHYRDSSANSDLERIEEDEEDCQDYYGNSNHFRTIYEEKLSPVILGRLPLSSSIHDKRNPHIASQCYEDATGLQNEFKGRQNIPVASSTTTQPSIANKHGYQQNSTKADDDCSKSSSSFNGTKDSNDYDSSFSNRSYVSDKRKMQPSSMTTNRPLTLYLPKPDEEIDLVEHIQALGHDLNIISKDLKIDTTCAHGYLWKCCSSNNKKWLKRYFYFDRSSKTLSYYSDEAQLVKRPGNPKNSIHLDEISDVYVDHKLSGIGEKNRTSKRKNYVFVLSTLNRKYLLASPVAATMRAWIDVLFTAAKADDYFHQMAPSDGNCTFVNANAINKDDGSATVASG